MLKAKLIKCFPLLLAFPLLSSAQSAAPSEVPGPTTPSPTNSPNACDGLNPGDIFFTQVRARDPDQVILFLFEDLPGDLTIYLTDNAWNGEDFENTEGILEYTTPPEGIPASNNIGFGPNAMEVWNTTEGSFSLLPEGEQVFLFCFGGNNIVPLAGISYAGPFAEVGLTNYGMNQSAVPESIAPPLSIVLPPCEIWDYNGPPRLQKEELRTAIQDPNNWRGQFCASSALNSHRGWSLFLSLGLSTTFSLLF